MDERSPARPAMTSVDQYGQPYTTSNQPNPYLAGRSGPLVMARGGDMIYATLLYGFNSDDVRGLPIYATLMDFLPNGERGPLHNARVQGQVAYSGHNAAIIFNHLVLPSGREFDISAIAVGRDARTGVAEKVDYHTLQRYGSLFLAGIISGIGEVAQYRLRDRDQGNTIIIGGEGDIHVGRRGEPTDGEVIAGALAPVGRNLSSAAQQGFNRPPTISAPAGMGFALVFTDTIVLDPTNEQRAYNPRTGRMEIVPAGSISAEPQPVQPDQTGALPTHNPFVDWQAADDGISDAIMQAFPQ